MELIDLTLATPAANLALDEALLDEAEHANTAREVLRLWEPARPFVVLGRNSSLAEVNWDECLRRDVPVVRRSSGGCAILAGPGCLMYAVVLSYDTRPQLRALEQAHRLVLETNLQALSSLAPQMARRGTSDLAAEDIKFSGNSLRCRRRALLYHGTLLYNFPIELAAACLTMPPRQPDYRQNRAHAAFIGNIAASAGELKQRLAQAWHATLSRQCWPQDRVRDLLAAGNYEVAAPA